MVHKRLIARSTVMREEIESVQKEYSVLSNVTIFFHNENFLITKYKPLSNDVRMILEFKDGGQLHIEGTNCGYGGMGPDASVVVLRMFGMNRTEMERLIFYYDALQFKVTDGKAVSGSVKMPMLFYPDFRFKSNDDSFKNMIMTTKNVSVDLVNGKVIFYNPQRNCWNGFLSLLSYAGRIEMEYFIGDNSPLAGGFRVKKQKPGRNVPDSTGTEHVNLILHGDKFSVVCLIDREDEIHVIDSVYLALTGRHLFKSERYDILVTGMSPFKIAENIFKKNRKKKYKIYDREDIEESVKKQNEIFDF